MNGPAVLVILVGAGEASDPTTAAMDRATRAALTTPTTVEVRESRSSTPSDDEAIAIERTTHPTALVELRWTEPTHRKAVLRVHIVEEARWVNRTIPFRATDAFAERGRTLGFAIASMLPEKAMPGGEPATGAAPAAAPSAAPTPASASGSTTSPSTSTSTATSTGASTGTATSTPAVTSTPTPTTTAPPSSTATANPAPSATSSPSSGPGVSSASRASATAIEPPTASSSEASTSVVAPRSGLSLSLSSLATLGVESSPTTFGGAAAFEWAPIATLSSVAMRAGASLRAGSLQDGSGSTLTFVPGIGLRWGFLAPAERRPLGASMHVEYLAVYQTVSHPSAGSSATQGTLLSGLGAVVDADLRISPGADLSVGVGFEEVFSPTYIVVGTATTGMLPATRALAEAGVRLAL